MDVGVAAIDDEDENTPDPDEPFVVPIEPAIDLHTFRPSEVKDLIPDWIDECVARGWTEVRVIHGKGTGSLRETVHSLLRKHPAVESFTLDAGRSGWGATVVRLRPTPPAG